MQKSIFVEATFRIVAQVKGHTLSDRQTIMVPVELVGTGMEKAYSQAEFKMMLFAQVDAAIRAKAVEAFIKRLKTETLLKRKVGGTKWAVDIVGGIEAQPLYLKEAQVGDFKQFLRGKKVSDRNEETGERTSKVIYPNIVDQIADRNYAIVKQLYEQPVAANETDLKKQA